jgi:serine/threonine protein kinase
MPELFTDEQSSFEQCSFCGAIISIGAVTCSTCGSSCPSTRKPSAPQTLEPGTRLFGKDFENRRVAGPDAGRFEVRGVIGHGNFGITYKAINKRMLDIVAIKEHFPQDFAERGANGTVQAKAGCETAFAASLQDFSLEAETLMRLHHENAVEALEVFEQHGTMYLVMKYLEGETLEARLSRKGGLSVPAAVKLLRNILEVLVAAHALGVLHRDIKPANIKLSPGRVQLLDFGAALHFDPHVTMNIAARTLTPAYAPLEQYASRARLTAATDLYSLSATVYEALSGVPPTSALEQANGVEVTEIDWLEPRVPASLARLLMSALALKITDRPESAGAMLEVLDGLQLS